MAAGGYLKAADLPQVIPVFPLDGVLLLPHGMLPLNIFEPRYLNMIDDVMSGDRIIGMIQTQGGQGGLSEEGAPALLQVGCAGRITSYAETPDGRYLITLTGVCRFRLGAELPVRTPYRQVRADFGPFEPDLQALREESSADRPALLSALKAYLERRGMEVDWRMAKEAPLEALVNSLAMALPFDQGEKQALLEACDLEARRSALTALLRIDAAVDDDNPSPLQ
jgi:Lon protease-like protein